MSDALAELVRALAALERAEERMAQAAHALAEAEGAAEDDPGAAAEAAAGFARRRELEAQLEPAEVMRAHSLVGGDQ
jgi:hypothetical protein